MHLWSVYRCKLDVPMTKVASDQSSPWPEWTMGTNKVDGTVKCDMSLDSSHQEESEYIKFYHKMFLIIIISKKTWKIQWFQIIYDNILNNHGYISIKLAIYCEKRMTNFPRTWNIPKNTWLTQLKDYHQLDWELD